MPTITIDKKVLDKIIGKKLPIDELKDRISMLGTDLESVTDKEIVVEIFPNRPDLLSEQGFGRALKSFLGIKTGLHKIQVKKSGHKVIVDKSVSMRPYTACAIVKNIKFTDERIKEVMQMQEKLATTHGRKRKKSAYGVYPTDNVKFPIRYMAKDPSKVMFQPLGFDKRMSALKVEEVHPTGKKYKHISDSWREKGYKVYPFFFDANNNAMCMLPYTNSDDTGKVEIDTKEVFIECTGTDFNNVHFALNMFVTMFSDMGGDVYSLEIEYPDKTITTPDLTPQKMKVDKEYVNKLLGTNLSEKDFKKNLEKMGYEYKNGTVYIPAYRADIIHPSDIGEDVAIAYGYENFKPDLPTKATTAKENDFEKFREKVAYLMTGLNMLETSSYNLSNEQVEFIKMNFSTDKYVKLLNSVSEEHDILRYWMLPSLLKILGENTHNEYPQNIFESGWVFSLDKKEETGVKEKNRLGALVCSADADYTKIRQVLDYLFRSLGLKYEIKETEHPSFISGRVGRVSVKGKEVAYIGEIHPQILEIFQIEMPVSAFELNLSEIFKLL